MKNNQILILKTLIEVYDRELKRVGQFHMFLNPRCTLCKSLKKQRNNFIVLLKKELSTESTEEAKE